ncbi:hypothetical protein TREMEDRAFT_62522 [Tremella mesenterica DSM 1558]|uniref:uncharacterized protein n=1 Tax=Tremella mesenterica (strain ATCC 24925 / CBS 8224 / DSM 1558 / NBRC 9311 / NRRL Y-6157 / RJB 2259-6 / UBC 559-6) TaxID=578456 RepID=UPI0003F4A451|nr:uncharacterized protein TREMEDRAFT_62522 [Tremella mesenterica DSM 1558]EIW69653.1 hypothetical protein TREMEDRAFT_62522 [Tremella mesenterica DSM 1558]
MLLSFIQILLLYSYYISTCAAQSATSTSSITAPSSIPTITIPTLPSLLALSPLNLSHPSLSLSLPQSDSLYVTLNLCSLSSNTSLLPTIRLSTSDPPSFILGSRTSVDVTSGGFHSSPNKRSRSGITWELEWDRGFANWTSSSLSASVNLLIGLGLSDDGIDTSVITNADGNVVVQIGLSSQKPIHSLSPTFPLLGDTTSTTALIFSPILQYSPQIQPTYPVYTFPQAQLTLPSFSPSTPTNFSSTNMSLMLLPTNESPTTQGLDHSSCAVRLVNDTKGISTTNNIIFNSSEPTWMSVGGEKGFRVFWVVGGLTAGGTNYTAWVVDDQGMLSRPIWLTTKEGDLISPTSPISTLPQAIVDLVTSSLEAFSVSLTTTACGRDQYSHVSTCLDCYTAYRDWVCRVTIPRCGSSLPISSTSPFQSQNVIALSSTTQGTDIQERQNSEQDLRVEVRNYDDRNLLKQIEMKRINDDEKVLPPGPFTIQRTSTSARIPSLDPVYTYDYLELLPCLSTCNAVDRACPAVLLFRCPSRSVRTANESYAFYGHDNDVGDGSGVTGQSASDRWGNVWCNGP